jgi:DNA-binding transcriptional LysR family regulator
MELSDRIARRMKLHDLSVLKAVVEVGSMNKAAALLNTTQSSVSRSIGELERIFGVRLLDRNSQGIEPTAFGRTLLEGGVVMFDDLRQVVKNLEFLADPAAGDVRIGCAPFLATGFVSAVIDRLSRRFPRAVFHLVSTQTEALHRALQEREVDFLIVQKFSTFTQDPLWFDLLYDDSYVVMAGAENPWSRRRKIELAELMSECWTLPPPTSAPGSIVLQAFRAAGLEYPRTTVFTAPFDTRMSLLTTGRFLTIVLGSALRFSSKRSEIKILPIKLPIANVPIGFVTLRNRAISPVARLFMEHARDVARRLPKKK